MKPQVSLIIRTLNEAEHLGDLLNSIRSQTYKNFEIVLVDSGSFDGTLEIAEKHCDKILKIKQDEFTFGFALNFGIKHATGELIGIISAHTIPLHDNWLKFLVNGFCENGKDEKVAMTYGKQLGTEMSNFSEKNDFGRFFGDTKTIQRSPNYFCNNANSMIRKDLWEQHPFDEALPFMEDTEWSKYWMDRGYVIVYDPGAAIYHIHKETPKHIKRRFWCEAVAARSIGVLNNWNVLRNVMTEPIYSISDILKAYRANKKDRLGEILTYRYNKLIGILKSLIAEKKELKDFSTHYAPFEYKALEITKPNLAISTTYSLEPTRPNDVLIKVAYVGICETDMEVLKGSLGYYKSGLGQYPIVPGHEFSGVVVRKGAKISNLEIGDAVVGQCILTCGICESCLNGNETACIDRMEVGVFNHDGAYREYISLPSRFVNRITDGVSLKTASSIEPVAVVLKGLRRIELKNSDDSCKENILIIGGGPIGHISTRICQRYGHNVSIAEENQIRLNMYGDIEIQLFEKLPKLDGFSVIVETTGVSEIAELIINESSNGVKILLLGLPYGNRSIDIENIVICDKTVIGSIGSSDVDFRRALDLVPMLNMNYFDNCEYGFDNWKEAWEKHDTKSELKVKLRIGGTMETKE
jgi:threonine dehydrogenase-like Zn-dependent dehydrogenase